MGGRTYDPTVGQMMQADAVVQSPMDGQNYNRYAYVFNNPMSYTDPTGYFASVHEQFFSYSYSHSSNLGPVLGSQSETRKAETKMDTMGDMAAANPGVSNRSVDNNDLAYTFGQNSFSDYLALQRSAMIGQFSGDNLVTRRDLPLQVTGEITATPDTPFYLQIPVYSGVVLGLGDSIGVVGSMFRSDGATVNYLTGESLLPGAAQDARFMTVMSLVPVSRLTVGTRSVAFGSRVAGGLGNQNPLYKAAVQLFKSTDLSNAGRALTKHPEVVGQTKETLRQTLRGDAAINDAAHGALRDIMRNGVTTTPTLGRYGTVTQVQIPGGFGARWASDGSFIGFINP